MKYGWTADAVFEMNESGEQCRVKPADLEDPSRSFTCKAGKSTRNQRGLHRSNEKEFLR